MKWLTHIQADLSVGPLNLLTFLCARDNLLSQECVGICGVVRKQSNNFKTYSIHKKSDFALV